MSALAQPDVDVLPTRPRITAVVVTYNRQQLVLQCVAAIAAQTLRPDEIVVVDNASDDGTATALAARFPDVEVATLPRNTGGAGGFAVGMAIALRGGAELVWLLDDDTEPQPSALEELLAVRDAYPGPAPVVLASRVVWTDGRDHPMNTPRSRPFASRAARRAAARAGARPIRSASFVSVLVDGAATRRLGLPRADFFLWNDDFEFTTRLLRYEVGLACPSSVVTHRTATFGDTSSDPGERFFFEVRNKVWTFTSPGTLGPVERLVYSASTLRRWARTIHRSRARGVLWRALGRGLLAGLRTKPRPTGDILAELGYAPH